MVQQIRVFDWERTSLGPIETWPRSLMNVLAMVLASRQPICFWWGPELLQFHNDDYLPMLADRVDRALGAPFKDLWSDVWEGVKPFVDEALSGQGTWAENLHLAMVRNGRVEQTYWTFSYSPLFDDDGRIAGLMNVVTETTAALRDREALAAEVARTNAALVAQREAERQQRLLQRELSHRMKNTLAMVQAIVSQSLRQSAGEEGARRASERIQALGRAQDMLTSASWQDADIRDVIMAAVEPHCDRPDRMVIEGPGIGLSAQQGLGLSLALHELSTNALKYGALSTDSGCVHVRWACDADGGFDFRWQEEGGPEVIEPERKGFGSRLTTRVVPTYFDGTASIEFRSEGLVYALAGRLAGDPRSGPSSPA
ncbi:sensor histidine kinase [Pelagibacterium montanilacus]|uniref:sensor histidine kinase n=1 Tax=Pelagibacterium montanilacus TaxID=2185280 RepID=UPI001FE54360|nr:PAS domain-containing sensor histidine kinase [Pelagibacterium montanilacus]